MKRRVEGWLRFAKVDIESAAKLLETDNLAQSAAFHCQQEIEKTFKAIIEEFPNEIPRTHDLIRLYGIIEDCDIIVKLDEDLLDQINDVYIEARYSSDLGLIPNGIPKRETVVKFKNLADNIFSQASKIIK